MRVSTHSRRQLLSLVPELRRMAAEVGAAARLIARRQDVLHIRRPAMACQFEILLPGERADWTQAAVAALEEVEHVEGVLSIYRPDSELSIVNREAFKAPGVAVGEELFEFLSVCARLCNITGGAFDPGAGVFSELWGFKQRAPRVPTQHEIDAARLKAGMRRVQLDANSHRVFFQVSGLTINPGAIGKGWALDRVVGLLIEAGVDNALVHAGGSSVRAIGRGPDGAGWPVRVPDERGGRDLGLRDRSMATTGASEQFFEERGIRYGHVVDPRSGMALQRRGTVSVVADSAAEADALSTALFVMNDSEMAEFVDAHPAVHVIKSTQSSSGEVS